MSDTISKLLERQRRLTERIAEERKRATERERAALAAKIERAGRAVLDAGLIDIPADQLAAGLKMIVAQRAKVEMSGVATVQP
ncbi:hypothetical protein GH865_12890 [Rhodocyclus tenuis]|uniref:hypothetical protein n=1 Tax=Rhodocyclus gracilis TaxID=2929842 RepID=UPI001298B976|nr:hypothetical protein [Rhodocyclus gracilis]MRD74136.1 hypothetical protein [Rhodocyclus gracilis]